MGAKLPLSFGVAGGYGGALAPYNLYVAVNVPVRLDVQYRIPSIPLLFLRGDVGYDGMLVTAVSPRASVHAVIAAAGGGLRLDPATWFNVQLYATLGMSYASFSNEGVSAHGVSPYLDSGFRLSFLIPPWLSFDAGRGPVVQ